MARVAGSAVVDFTARTTKLKSGTDEARRLTREAAREMKANIKEANGTIALLGEEIGVRLPRHLRTFVSKLPGVASALSAAFSGAAIVGLGMIAVEQAKKIYEAFENVRDGAEKAHEAWQKQHAEMQATDDELRKMNDELQNAINKFKGVKENILAVQLDDIAIEAGKVAKQMNAAAEATEKLFKEHAITLTGELLGKGTGGDAQEQYQRFWDNQVEIARNAQGEIDKLRDEGTKESLDQADQLAAQTAARLKANAASFQAERKTVLDGLKEEQAEWDKLNLVQKAANTTTVLGLKDQTQAIHNEQGAIDNVTDATNILTDSIKNSQLQRQRAAQTGMSAADAAKKAAEEEARREKFVYEMRKKQTKEYQDYKTKLTEDAARLDEETSRQLQEMYKADAEASKKAAEDIKKENEARTESAAQIYKTSRDQAAQEYEEYAQDQAAMVQIGMETNSQRIDNLKSALAATHDAQQAYFKQQADLYAADAKQRGAIQEEMVKDTTEFNRRMAELNREAMSLGLTGMMNEMIARALDMQTTIRGIFTNLISGINEQLTNLMTGKRTEFKSMMSGIFGQVAKGGLETGEGMLVKTIRDRFGAGVGGMAAKAFGVKKDGSSPDQALYVRLADDAKKTGIAVGNALSGTTDPSTATQSGGLMSSGAGFLSTLGSMLFPFHLASGGPVSPGRAYLVGERGPEPFFPGVFGTVGTNAALRSAFASGGGGSTINVPIDARGSTDPAAVNAAIHRAMRAYMPMLVTTSAAFQHDIKRRVPSTSPNQ